MTQLPPGLLQPPHNDWIAVLQTAAIAWAVAAALIWAVYRIAAWLERRPHK